MEPIQEQDLGKQGGAHWSVHPWKLLGWTIAAMLIAFLTQYAVSHTLRFIPPDSYIVFCILTDVAGLVVPAAFYLVVRCAQKRHGVGEKPSWKIGVVFWVGMGLVVLSEAIEWLPHSVTQLESFTLNVALLLVNGFYALPYVALLFPVLEKKMGMMKSALIYAGASALVIILLEAVLIAVTAVHWGQPDGAVVVMPGFLNDILPSTLSACAKSFAIGALLVALFHAAGRRMPGAWMLFAAIPQLLTILHSLLLDGLLINGESSAWLQLCIEFPFYLVVFAVSLGLIAAFRRWKTFGAFWQDAKVVLRRTQGDIDK